MSCNCFFDPENRCALQFSNSYFVVVVLSALLDQNQQNHTYNI